MSRSSRSRSGSMPISRRQRSRSFTSDGTRSASPASAPSLSSCLDTSAVTAFARPVRGPGELIGSRQSGLPLLRFADLERDTTLLDLARDYAQRALDKQPELIPAHLARWIGARQQLSDT